METKEQNPQKENLSDVELKDVTGGNDKPAPNFYCAQFQSSDKCLEYSPFCVWNTKHNNCYEPLR